MKVSTELFKGYVDLLILLSLTNNKMYGYELRQHVYQTSQFRCQLSEGTLYTALHKLLKQDFLSCSSKKVDGRKRKYYTVTSCGERRLKEMLQEWNFLNSLVVQFSSD